MLQETPDDMPVHVSVKNQLPEDLYRAMGLFISEHPQWDQYLGGLFRRNDCPASQPLL